MGRGDEVAMAGGGAWSGAPVDVVAEAEQVVASFAQSRRFAPWSEQLVAMRSMIDQLEGLWLTEVGHFEQADGPEDDGSVSLTSWLRHRCRIAPTEAKARAAVARGMNTGLLHETAGAMRSGEVSWRHASVVAGTLSDVPAEHRVAAEQALQEPAKTLDPQYLRRVGAELLHRLDVDKAERAAVRRLERRGLDIAETFDGMVAVRGMLDPIAGATLMTAIDAKVQPTRGDLTDERSWSQRRADALTEITREWLDFGEPPQVGGQRPHVSVIVDVRTLAKEPGSGPGHVEWAGPLTAEEARMVACDAGVSRIVSDGPSQILDVGRATRTIPPAIRRAVVARDRHCVADGCYRSAAHCDVHHIVFWENGGETSLDNLALLCRRHHGFVHQRGWQVQQQADGSMRFLPRRSHAPP